MRPAPAFADAAEVAPDVRGHRWRRIARQHPIEVLARKVVLALEVEGERELETHSFEPRAVVQNGPEGDDRLVKQMLALVAFALARRLKCSRAGTKEFPDPVVGQGCRRAGEAEHNNGAEPRPYVLLHGAIFRGVAAPSLSLR